MNWYYTIAIWLATATLILVVAILTAQDDESGDDE